jgi:hypothetical protein
MTDRPRPTIRNPECFHPWPGCYCPKWIPAPAVPEPVAEVQTARREYSIQAPIRPGTARQLGIRRPPSPPQWLLDMQAKLNLTFWQLDMLDRFFGNPPGTWRLRAAAGEDEHRG